MIKPHNKKAEDLLIEWAEWKIREGLYLGFGNSIINKFNEVFNFCIKKSKPLYYGNINPTLAKINSMLTIRLGKEKAEILLLLYGSNCEIEYITKKYKLRYDAILYLKKRARKIVLNLNSGNGV